MKRHLQFCLLVTFLVGNIYAQNLKIGFEGGRGSYTMKEMKDVNNLMISEIPFDSKIVTDFPSNYYIQPSISLDYQKFSLGIIYAYNSTGSRISSIDYSGEYRYDLQLSSNSPALQIEYYIYKKKFEMSFYTNLGLVYTKLTMHELLTVYDTNLDNSKNEFLSINSNLEPGFHFSRNIGVCNIGINVGYSINYYKQGFYLKDNKKIPLMNGNDQVKPDWSGLRYGIFLKYNLNTIFHSSE